MSKVLIISIAIGAWIFIMFCLFMLFTRKAHGTHASPDETGSRFKYGPGVQKPYETGEAWFRANGYSDDTEQMSWYDRDAYMASQERMTDSNEAFLAPTMQEIYADVAQMDAYLNEGHLAYPSWIHKRMETA